MNEWLISLVLCRFYENWIRCQDWFQRHDRTMYAEFFLTFILFGRRWSFVLHRREIREVILGAVKLFREIVHVAKNEFPTPNVDHISCTIPVVWNCIGGKILGYQSHLKTPFFPVILSTQPYYSWFRLTYFEIGVRVVIHIHFAGFQRVQDVSSTLSHWSKHVKNRPRCHFTRFL